MEQAEINLPATTETGSLAHCTMPLTLTEMSALPARLDDTMLAMVDLTAAASLPVLPQTDEQHLTKCFTWLDAALPRQKSDELSGKARLAIYSRMLGHLPKDAVNYATEAALKRFDWFPTIKQLLAIAEEWERNDDALRAQRVARIRAYSEREARLGDARQGLKYGKFTQDQIDALSQTERQILRAEGLLVLCAECGSGLARKQPGLADLDEDLGEIVARVEARFASARA